MDLSSDRSPIRVIHIVSGDLWAGAEVMTYHLVSDLHSTHVCEVLVICLNEGELAARLRERGVEVVVVDERAFSFVGVLARIARLLYRRRVDVIHSHRYKEHLIAAALAPLYRAGLVATVHGLPEPRVPRSRSDATVQWATFQLLRHRFDTVVAVSSHVRRVLVDRFGLTDGSVHMIHNGVPPVGPNAPTQASGHRYHIGSVGRLVPVKRYSMFVDTVATLRRSIPNLRATLVGEGPEHRVLLDRASAAGLGDSFHILGAMRDPSAFYASLDLYVNTSISEGLPLSILEAMRAGAPVVAAAVGGIPEVVRHGIDGWLVSDPSPEVLASACAGLLGNPRLRAEFGIQARSRVAQEFSAARMATQYVQEYGRASRRVVGTSRDGESGFGSSRG